MDFNKALFGFIRVAFSIMIALLVLFAGIKICSICYDFGYRVFTEPAMTNGDGQDVLVQVEKGISAEELGQLLEDKGLVRDHNLFYLQLKLSAYSGHIKPGIYTLNTSMTAKDMMVIMSSDKSDEEQQRVYFVFAFFVYCKNRPDEQHSRPCGSHEGRKHEACSQHGSVYAGTWADVSADVNSTRDDIECQKKDDERQIVIDNLMLEFVCQPVPYEKNCNRSSQQERHKKFVGILIPPFPGEQRTDGDHYQHHGERKHRPCWYRIPGSRRNCLCSCKLNHNH